MALSDDNNTPDEEIDSTTRIKERAAKRCPNKKQYPNRKKCVRDCETQGGGTCYNQFDFMGFRCECRGPGDVGEG